MRRILGLLAMGGLLLAAGDETGVRPRPSASDYPAHAVAGGVTVAAAVVPKEQVSKLFATDLNKDGYIVMEVAVFPEEGRDVQLAARDFMLASGDGSTIRPAAPAAIAARFDRKHEPRDARLPGNVDIYPSATIGYERGTYNGRTQSGVYTGAGVGVGAGGPGPMPQPPGASGPDGYEIRRELEGKSLPEGRLDHAVAGFLYFPKPDKKVGKEGYRLTWYGPESQVRLTVPLPRK